MEGDGKVGHEFGDGSEAGHSKAVDEELLAFHGGAAGGNGGDVVAADDGVGKIKKDRSFEVEGEEDGPDQYCGSGDCACDSLGQALGRGCCEPEGDERKRQ